MICVFFAVWPLFAISKLVVSATHPNFLFITSILFKCGANVGQTFGLCKSFLHIFFTVFMQFEITR